MTATLTPAKFVECAGIQAEGRYIHSMRDNCSSCAPYWESVPVCPTDNVKLRQTATKYDPNAPVKGYCRTCRKHFDITEHHDITR